MKSYAKNFTALVLCAVLYVSCSEMKSPRSETTATTEASSLPDTATGDDRVIIKTADISMDVNSVEESVQAFQELVNAMHGHVYHYEIQNEKYVRNEVQHTMDSSIVINEIHPQGMMKVKVPVQYGDTFVSAVLKMNGSIVNFLLDENDVTEDITEKKELMLNDAGISHQKHKPGNTEEDYFDKETKESYIARKAAFSKMNYQTKYLWFDISLKGKTYTDKQIIASAETVRTPFYVRATEALNNGWYGFSLFITLLLNLWPFFIFALLALIIIKRFQGSKYKSAANSR